MVAGRQETRKPIKERLWDITQALVAGLLFAAISGGTAYLYGLGGDHRSLSARVDAELAPINGASHRDIIMQMLAEMEHWKGRGHRLEERVLTMDKGFHQEIEALARYAAEVKSKCDIISERCEYYRSEATGK